MTTSLQTIHFNNEPILTTFKENSIFFGVKSICENLCLQWSGQLQRLKRDLVLSKGMCMIHIPSKMGLQPAVFLPLKYLNGFLFKIEASRIKNIEVKKKILKYQEECYDVLHNHFLGQKTSDTSPSLISPNEALILERLGIIERHLYKMRTMNAPSPNIHFDENKEYTIEELEDLKNHIIDVARKNEIALYYSTDIVCVSWVKIPQTPLQILFDKVCNKYDRIICKRRE